MKRRALFSRAFTGLVGLSAPLWLKAAGQAAAPSAPPRSAGERRRVRMGLLPIESCTQAFVAQEQGFFAEEGLDVQITFMAGGAVVAPAVAGGTLDVGYSNIVSLLIARDRGFDFQVIAEGGIHSAQTPSQKAMVLPDSPVRGPRDLEGRTYALNTLGNIDELSFRLWARKNGADPSKIKVVEVGFPNMAAALAQGRVDAVQIAEPFMTLAVDELKARSIGVPWDAIGPRFAISGYFGSRSWIEGNRDVAARVARALSRATEWLNNYPDRVPRIVAAYTRVSESLARRMVRQVFSPRLRLSDFQVLEEPLFQEGWVSRRPNAADLISSVAQVES